MPRSFLERNVESLFAVFEQALVADSFASKRGLLQQLDPRVKLIGFLSLLVVAIAARNLLTIAAIFFLALALAFFSQIPVRPIFLRTWLAVLFFTGVIALPAIFITPGPIALRIPFAVTWPGLRAAAFLVSRAETAATCALTMVLSTPWARLLRALRVLRLPLSLVVILGMTQRYIFLLLRTAHDFFEARRCRILGPLHAAERRRLASANAAVLMQRSLDLGADVYAAMQARGFRGEVQLLDDLRFRSRDYFALALFLAAAAVLLWSGWN